MDLCVRETVSQASWKLTTILRLGASMKSRGWFSSVQIEDTLVCGVSYRCGVPRGQHHTGWNRCGPEALPSRVQSHGRRPILAQAILAQVVVGNPFGLSQMACPSVAMVQGHLCRPAWVATCRWGASCPYLRRGCCLFRHSSDEVAAASLVGQDSESMESIPLASLDSLAERVTQLERVVEQIAGAPVPQILEGVDGLQHVPQERVQNRTPEQIVDVPVPQITEAIVVDRFPEQLVDVPVPQIMEAIVENRFPEQLVDVPVPQIVEAIVVDLPEQIVDVPVPQITEEIMENRFPEQLVDVPVPQITEAIVENRFPEQLVDVPVPQIVEAIVENLPEQIVDVPVPQITEAIVVDRFPEQIVDVPVPQIMEAIVVNRFPEQLDVQCLRSWRQLWRIVSRSILWMCQPQFMEHLWSWSRLRFHLCLRSWRPLWRFCLPHHRSACRIVRLS